MPPAHGPSTLRGSIVFSDTNERTLICSLSGEACLVLLGRQGRVERSGVGGSWEIPSVVPHSQVRVSYIRDNKIDGISWPVFCLSYL